MYTKSPITPMAKKVHSHHSSFMLKLTIVVDIVAKLRGRQLRYQICHLYTRNEILLGKLSIIHIKLYLILH